MGRVIGSARALARAGAGFIVRPGSWQEAVRELVFATGLAFAAFGGTACAPSGGGGSTGGGGGSTTNPGDIVGQFELAAPTIGDFILHGTLPVPPGTFRQGTGTTPFRVVDIDGSRVAAQTEIVSRYADPADGADVVEILAHVRTPPGSAPGDRIRYLVVYEPVDEPTFHPNGGVHGLLNGAQGLLARTRDVFGNLYVSDLLLDLRQGGGSARSLKNGSEAIQTATHQSLLPVAPSAGPSGTLPHLMGVHAYVTEWSEEPFFTLDLRIHNAHSGENQGDPNDDALGQMYFDSFELLLPTGWTVFNAFPDPWFGAPYDEGGSRVWPIVSPIAGGPLHVMPAMSQFHRRLVVVRNGSEARAQAYLREETLGFCRADRSPTGGDLWSWWNPLTARYFPQRHRMPSLDHVNIGMLRQQDDQALAVRANQVRDGVPGPWPSQSSGLGWAHPWGIEEGGMVSGLEIHLYEGVSTACAASSGGYRFSQLVHRMLADRQANVLFNANGISTRLEEWLIPGPNGPLLPVWWFGGPMLWAADPFGITTSPSFQRNAVVALGRQPPWEWAQLAFEPIDSEHLIRYTRMAKALAWLGNDAIAKDDLRAQAEGVRMGYNMYRQDSYPQGYVSTGMYADRLYVDNYPGWGFSYGRAEGWGLDTMNAAYSLGDPAWRASVRAWFDLVVDLLRDGQMDCTGIMQATYLGNVFNGAYRCRQSIEAAITENGIVGMRESVFQGVDPAKTTQANTILEEMAYAMISPLVWDEFGHGPWALMAVGPANMFAPPFCDTIPADGNYGYPDHALPWNTFAYGYELTNDPVFLDKAAEAMGAGNLQAACYAMGANEIQNRAALLALVQTF